MSRELESAKINMWKESLETSVYSFFGVVSDLVHVFILVRFLSQEQVGLFFICYDTHPTIDGLLTDGLSASQSDMDIGEHPAVCGMVILSRDMFDVSWDGKAVYFPENGSLEETTFRIECDGTTDGLKRDRWAENPEFV